MVSPAAKRSSSTRSSCSRAREAWRTASASSCATTQTPSSSPSTRSPGRTVTPPQLIGWLTHPSACLKVPLIDVPRAYTGKPVDRIAAESRTNPSITSPAQPRACADTVISSPQGPPSQPSTSTTSTSPGCTMSIALCSIRLSPAWLLTVSAVPHRRTPGATALIVARITPRFSCASCTVAMSSRANASTSSGETRSRLRITWFINVSRGRVRWSCQAFQRQQEAFDPGAQGLLAGGERQPQVPFAGGPVFRAGADEDATAAREDLGQLLRRCCAVDARERVEGTPWRREVDERDVLHRIDDQVAPLLKHMPQPRDVLVGQREGRDARVLYERREGAVQRSVDQVDPGGDLRVGLAAQQVGPVRGRDIDERGKGLRRYDLARRIARVAEHNQRGARG